MSKLIHLIYVSSFSIFLSSCTLKEEEAAVPSTNLAEIEQIINLDLKGVRGKFEMLSLPESKGLPSPTDDMLIVAELDSDKLVTTKDNSIAPAELDIWLVPNANRAWLSESFRDFLKLYENKKFPHDAPDCSIIATTFVVSRGEVLGYQCKRINKIFLYLHLPLQE